MKAGNQRTGNRTRSRSTRARPLTTIPRSTLGTFFDLKAAGYFYTRLANPTVGYVEEKLAALEGGVGAMCTSSGQAANMIAVLNIMGAGDHMVCASEVYGGTINLFGVTMEKLGIECTFVNQDAPDDEIEKAFRPNTKLVFGETVANPAISVFDIERFANLAHRYGVPLVVDNTFATPVLCRPFEFGADIVTHSTSKYMDGHAVQLGGVLIDGGTFDWKDYPGLTEPDESYHGVVYTETFGRQAYITKARTQLMRDIGASPTAHAAFLLNLGLETLALRMERHSANAQETAEFLAEQPEVEFVNYPGLKGDKYYSLGQKYLPDGASGVISFSLKGGRDAAVKFMDSLEMASNVVHVATVKTCVLHPASETHRQLSDEQLANAGITPGMIRLSVGIEDIDDIIEDLSKGFASIR